MDDLKIKQLPKIKVKEKDIVGLTEQLNGLLKSYDSIYGYYADILLPPNDERKAELKEVLDDIKRAIKAVCFEISHNTILVD